MLRQHEEQHAYHIEQATLHQKLSQMEYGYLEQAMRNGPQVSKQSITLRMDRTRELSAKARYHLFRAIQYAEHKPMSVQIVRVVGDDAYRIVITDEDGAVENIIESGFRQIVEELILHAEPNSNLRVRVDNRRK